MDGRLRCLLAPSRRRCAKAALAFAIAIATVVHPRTAAGQWSVTGTLRGLVQDTTGGVLPGASVTLTSSATYTSQAVVTNQTGQYAFVGVFPGTYALRVELAGFKPWEQTGLTIRSQDTLGVNVRLEVGGQAERVTVTAAGDIVRTESGARESVVTAQQIDNLSIISRSALELLRVLPGVVAPDQARLESVGGASDPESYTVNGIRSTSNTVQLDGSSLLDIGCNCGSIVTLNSDMVQEVKVQSSNYAAEYGSGGVAISAVTKSGGSALHGELYAYNRDHHLASNDLSNIQFGIPKPKSSFNYPGGNVGGPIAVPGWQYTKSRDKLFFFLGLEAQRQKLDRGAHVTVVPTLLQREGVFTESLDPIGDNLGQPVGPVLIPGGFPGAGTPAPGADLRPFMTPLGRALVGLYPLPTGSYENNRYNYAVNNPLPDNRVDFKTRVDWNVTASTRAYLRIAREDETVHDEFGVWGAPSDVAVPSPAIGHYPGRSYSASIVTVLSPSSTNEALLSWSRLRIDYEFQNPSKMRLGDYGVSWTGPFPDQSPWLPQLITNWGGSSGIGSLWSASTDAFSHNDALQFSDKLTRLVGAHALKFGVSVERLQKQQSYPENDAEGQFQFDPSSTPGTTGNTVGDVLAGRLAAFAQGTAVPIGHFRMWNVDAFAQDSWKLRRNVTLEFGIRGGYWTNNTELGGLGGWFDPARYDPRQPQFLDAAAGTFRELNGVCYVNTGCAPPGILPNRNPFVLPRVNAVWNIDGDGNNVLRGGYGLFVNRPMGNVEYENTFFLPPAIYHVQQDAFGGFDYGGGVGLTYDTAHEATLASRIGEVPITTFTPNSFTFPVTHSFSVSYARRIVFDQLVEAAYVGTRGRTLVGHIEGNAVPEGALLGGIVGNADLSVPVNRVALDPTVVNQFRPYRSYPSIAVTDFGGVSDYNSLQVTLSRQAGKRLQYFAAYTWSRTRGTFDAWGGDYNKRDPFVAARSYALSANDRTHTLAVSWNAFLPDGARGFLHYAWLRGILNGWQLSGISTFASGAPMFLYFDGDARQPGVLQAWHGTPDVQEGPYGPALAPVYTCDPRGPGGNIGDKVLDLQCIGFPALGESGQPLPPYDIRQPGRQTHDLTVFKNFSLPRAQKLQLRVGFFNLFNMPWSYAINTSLGTMCERTVDHVPNGLGGYVDQVCDPASGFTFTDDTRNNFGKITSQTGHRVIEFALKYYF